MQGKRNQWARIGHEEDGEGGELGRGWVGWLGEQRVDVNDSSSRFDLFLLVLWIDS